MARIRTVKPEFWVDETVAELTRDARLLFIATFNFADDEGLLRWNAAYIKSSAFLYDDDLNVKRIEKLMAELVDKGLVFPYMGGRSLQRLAFIVNFRRHQKINRPQPSRLPPPSLQSNEVRYMYGRRDGMVCHLCGGPINEQPETYESLNISIDHLVPRSEGGSDYPSNVAAAHCSCNKSRGSKPPADSVNDSVNGSRNGSSQADDPFTAGSGSGSGSGSGMGIRDGEVDLGSRKGTSSSSETEEPRGDWTILDDDQIWTKIANRRLGRERTEPRSPTAWLRQVARNTKLELQAEGRDLLERYPDLTADELARRLDGDALPIRYRGFAS